MPKSVLRWIEKAEARRFRVQALLQRAAGEPVVVISAGPRLTLARRTLSLFGLAEPAKVPDPLLDPSRQGWSRAPYRGHPRLWIANMTCIRKTGPRRAGKF